MKINRTDNNELFSAIIHEIKNSLNPVINLSALMLRNAGGRLTEDEKTWLEAIARNGNRIYRLVEEFSSLKKLPAGFDLKSASRVSITEIAETAYSASRGLVAPGAGGLIFDGPGCEAVTDKTMLRKIFENVFHYFLISDGGRDIFVSSLSTGSLYNSVISRRSGAVPGDDSSSGGKDTLPETGFSATRVIWLQFAVMYIHAINGTASFSFDSEGDAVFSFSIPSQHAGHAVPDIAADVEITAPRSVPTGFVILIIDDDIDNITPVNAIIENEFNGAAKVYHAESGSRGLDLLETLKPDIILLDLTLPDISGLSLVRNIKHLFVRKNIPVIAFTALDIANDREKLFKSGFDDVIKKPFSIETFIQTINKWISE